MLTLALDKYLGSLPMNSQSEIDFPDIFELEIEEDLPSKCALLPERNLGLQQQIRRCFLSNGPFLMSTAKTDITIIQNSNVLAINISTGRIQKAKNRALHIWRYILSRMREEGWDLEHDDEYHEKSGTLSLYVGSKKILDGRIKLDGVIPR